jgi:hypothetical protein
MKKSKPESQEPEQFGMNTADKQTELADFARFLLARQDDEAWERRLASPQARPRLEAFLHDSAAEGDEPLDPNRL